MMCCSVNVNTQSNAVVLMVPLLLIGTSGFSASLPPIRAWRSRKYWSVLLIQSRRLVDSLTTPLNQNPLALVNVAAARKLVAVSIIASGTLELLRSRYSSRSATLLLGPVTLSSSRGT